MNTSVQVQANEPLITLSKDALVSMLQDRNQRIEELEAQLEFTINTAMKKQDELKAQLAECQWRLKQKSKAVQILQATTSKEKS